MSEVHLAGLLLFATKRVSTKVDVKSFIWAAHPCVSDFTSPVRGVSHFLPPLPPFDDGGSLYLSHL